MLASVRLLCFPYAGGGAGIYRTWPKDLPHHIEVLAADLPGREARINDPPFKRVADVVQAIWPALRPVLDLPLAIFGHSMGAVLAFAVAHRLTAEGYPPVRLFASGRRAPDVAGSDASWHRLPDDRFVARLRDLGGSPVEVFEHAELLELALPCLRADFEMCERYEHVAGAPLTCPISVFGGASDPETTDEGLAAWAAHTQSTCEVKMFASGHFFVQDCRSDVLDALALTLAHDLAR